MSLCENSRTCTAKVVKKHNIFFIQRTKNKKPMIIQENLLYTDSIVFVGFVAVYLLFLFSVRLEWNSSGMNYVSLKRDFLFYLCVSYYIANTNVQGEYISIVWKGRRNQKMKRNKSLKEAAIDVGTCIHESIRRYVCTRREKFFLTKVGICYFFGLHTGVNIQLPWSMFSDRLSSKDVFYHR